MFSILKMMLSAMLRDSSLRTVYILMDILDECNDYSDQLIEQMIKDASKPFFKDKWLLSSRYTTKIQETFRLEGQRQKLSLELNKGYISQAIDIFI